RARRDRRVVRAAESERDGELAAARVDEHAGDERRGHAIRPARAQDLGLLGDADHPADGRAEEDADARRVVRAVETRVGDAHGEPARVERADEVHSALSGDRSTPRRARVVPDRRHRAEPRHDNSSHQRNTTVTRVPFRTTSYGLRLSSPIAHATSASKSQTFASPRIAPVPGSRRTTVFDCAGRKWMTKWTPRSDTRRPEPHSASGFA